MINLIPNEEKKKKIRGLYYRLLVLFFVICAFSIFIVFVSILPSYFLSSAKDRIVNEKLETQKNEPVPVPDQQTLDVIKDLDGRLSLIENAEKSKFIVSEKVINAIIVKKMPNIQITDISYQNSIAKDQKSGSASGKKISIQGNAPSREALLLFRKALEDSSAFKGVDLPISNFVKGSNIQFYLSLIPA